MDKKFPKVLVISINAWRDNSGISTLLNLFKGWNPDKLAQIYTRSDLPDTKACNHFFQISEGALIRKIFKPKVTCGVHLTKEIIEKKKDEVGKYASFETKNIVIAKKHSSWVLAFIRELIWRFIPFNRKAMNLFVDEYDPDVIFLPIYPVIYMNRLQYNIIRNSKKKIVAFIGDDNYTYKPGGLNPLFYVYRFFIRSYIRKIIAKCSNVFVMVPKMQREYDKLFNIESTLLTKGIDLTKFEFQEKKVSTPIKIVYTGKTIYGRYKSLIAIANALRGINRNEIKIQLYIYTTDKLSKKLQNQLNVKGSVFLMGGVSFQEIPKIQQDADILLFVESLDNKYKNLARLSFSTKLTDYMQAGRCIMAIGDKNIAPIEYLKEEGAALIATTYEDISLILHKIIENPTVINNYAEKAFQCGIRNHNEKDILEKMYKILTKSS